MSVRHLLDTPCAIDDVRLLCGPMLDEVARHNDRREHIVTGTVAIVSCMACLRAYAVKQDVRVGELERALERAGARVPSPDPEPKKGKLLPRRRSKVGAK